MDKLGLEKDIHSAGLIILGELEVTDSDPVPKEAQSILLLGPDEPNFWKIFKESKEFNDLGGNPLDRWSKRIIDNIARENNCTALYPFGGEPYKPFFSWALRSGTVWSSPVHLAVHKDKGLFVSFRGALAINQTKKTNQRFENPCAKCSAPCLRACPVDAFTETGYDVMICKDHISDLDSSNCKSLGCNTRRACPVGANLRNFEQSAFHMEKFLR
jgi:ferredoxin